MEKFNWKKILLAVAGLLTLLAGGNQVFGGRPQLTKTILDGATNVSTSANVISLHDASDVVCTIAWDGPTASSTLRFAGSLTDTAPNFRTAQSSTNQWEYLDSTDMQSLASIDGDTGYSASTTADFRMMKIDTKYMSWFTVLMTTATPGVVTMPRVTVQCLPSDSAK